MLDTDTQLYSYSAFYYTPNGRKTYVIGIKRGRVEGSDIDRVEAGEITKEVVLVRDVERNIRIDMCGNPRRNVAKGTNGITITRLEPIED